MNIVNMNGHSEDTKMASTDYIMDILVKRDGITREEAQDLIDECRERIIKECSDEPIMDILGLEPDYIFDIIG